MAEEEGALEVRPDPTHKGPIQATDLVFKKWGGVSNASPRQAIGDGDFYWLENLDPSEPGKLRALKQALNSGLTYASLSVLNEVSANIGGTDYIFTFLSDGSASKVAVGALTSPVSVAAAGTFTTAMAIPYTTPADVAGLLIIDTTNGYFDYNLTTANTLTNNSNSMGAITINAANTFLSGFSTKNVFSGTGSGSGANVQGYYRTASIQISAAGTGYVVGDLLTVVITGLATQVTSTQITVTAIGSGGTITGISITQVGMYPGGTTLAQAQTGFTSGNPGGGSLIPAGTLGGSGSGATVIGYLILDHYVTLAPGGGYLTPFTITDEYNTHLGEVGSASSTAAVSGALNGTAIATYAGRVWIATGRSISYTDINSYNSFGGAGGQLTITDSYLHNNITALYSAFQFLYIFGDTSIDALSNVQINSGVTSFSRTNITTSIGTTWPKSIFTYYRQLMFGNSYGFYALSGASPDKISQKIDGLFTSDVFVSVGQGGTVIINGKLAACWLLRIIDVYTTLYGTNVTRTLLVARLDGRWFFYYPGFDFVAFTSIPTNGLATLYGFSSGTGAKLYTLFSQSSTTITSMFQTKLWDGGDSLLQKDGVRAGLEMNVNAVVNTALTFTVDNEYVSNQVVNITGPALGFNFLAGINQTNGGKYMGVTCIAQQTDFYYSFVALQYKAGTPWK